MPDTPPRQPARSERERRAEELARSLSAHAAVLPPAGPLLSRQAKILVVAGAALFLVLNGWFIVNALGYRATQLRQARHAETREAADDARQWERLGEFERRQRGMAESLKRIEAATVR